MCAIIDASTAMGRVNNSALPSPGSNGSHSIYTRLTDITQSILITGVVVPVATEI